MHRYCVSKHFSSLSWIGHKVPATYQQCIFCLHSVCQLPLYLPHNIKSQNNLWKGKKKHFFWDIQSFCKGCNGFIWQSFRLLNICVIWFWLTSCCNRWLMFYIIFIVPSLAAPPFDISDLWSIFLGKYFPFSGGILVANVSFLTTNLAAERRCDNT